jgi:Spy/CpxP family protein refolding chaperone
MLKHVLALAAVATAIGLISTTGAEAHYWHHHWHHWHHHWHHWHHWRH